jgi:hypothetical protein
MYVKIMSGENIPDGDSRKQFELFAGVTSVEFRRDPIVPSETRPPPVEVVITLLNGAVTFRHAWGNVYALNDDGKTIETFGIARYSDPDCAFGHG